MSRISNRYAPHVLVLIALVSVPAFYHETGRSYRDDCANPEALENGFDYGTSLPVEQLEDRLTRNQIQWTEGRLDAGGEGEGGPEIEFAIARSFRPSSLYFGFTRLRPGFIEPEEIRSETMEVDGEPVAYRVMVAREEVPARLAVYMTVFGNRPVPNPFFAQLRSAISDLFSGLTPMTLFFLYAEVPHALLDTTEDRAEAWLAEAWRQYRAACRPDAELL